ncbi:hypothetical protein, partial [uncultured Bradyrhizobium sp.]|uniref:hypothetical protein n=1 Tax=uncultured Bradyrhizobium sp. TaxID=199684 RepID=UPI0027D9ADA2
MGLYLYNTHHHDGKRCVHEYWDGVAPRNSMPRPVCGYFAGVFGLAGAVCLCETTAFPDEASGAAGGPGARPRGARAGVLGEPYLTDQWY